MLRCSSGPFQRLVRVVAMVAALGGVSAAAPARAAPAALSRDSVDAVESPHASPGTQAPPSSAVAARVPATPPASAPDRTPAFSQASRAPAATTEAPTAPASSTRAPASPSTPRATTPQPLAPAPKPKDDRLERLGIAGGMMVGNAYMLGVTLATGALVVCWADPHSSTCLLPKTRAAWFELYIPIFGPFVALGHDAVRKDLKYVLAFGALGTLQSVGFVLASAALLTWSDDDLAGSFALSAELTPTRRGLSLSGRF